MTFKVELWHECAYLCELRKPTDKDETYQDKDTVETSNITHELQDIIGAPIDLLQIKVSKHCKPSYFVILVKIITIRNAELIEIITVELTGQRIP